jgi:hypothetical protein
VQASAQPQSTAFFVMPLKRKDNAATPAAGPKPKRSKAIFRTPTTAALEDAAASQPSSSKNRVVTLRTGASGRRGYRTQELSATSSTVNSTPDSNSKSSAATGTTQPSGVPDAISLADTRGPELQSDSPPASSAKPRAKQKNTTTVRQ